MMDDEPLTSPPQSEPSRGPWLGLGIGAAVVIIVIAVLVYNSRNSESRYVRREAVMQSSGAPDPYAEKLKLSDINLSAAENFVGGTATYIEGKINNIGDKTVTGATVEITFRNSLDQIVQRETHNLMIVLSREPAIDVAALSASPLKPGESKEFRLTFEHVSADWNRQYPEIQVKLVDTR
jgi:hypothetical protein